MLFGQLEKLIKSGKIPATCLLTGDAFLRQEAMRRIRKYCEQQDFEISDFSVPERSTAGSEPFHPQSLHNALRSHSLFQSQTLILVSPADGLLKKYKELVNAHLKAPLPDHILVMEAAKGTLKTKKKTDLFQQKFTAVKGRNVPPWVMEQAASLGLKLSASAAAHLSNAYTGDLRRIDSELKKLSSIIDPQATGTIDKKAIEFYCIPDQEKNIFVLQDSICEKHTGRALKALDYFDDESGCFIALGAINRLIRQLRQVHELKKSGMGKNDLAQKLKLHPFVAQKLLGYSRRFTEKELLQKEKACLDIDLQAKSTSAKTRLLCEQLLFTLCSQQS